ncbi:hypothetical protein M5K25_027814 [Dendrobium thyrsiflorum]|uniref:Uncharacterized protein n=1 Tax=Dendrobium thyrsiflorum TaxID=117978 RepID=A0ABD0TV61_DENTH
MVSGFHADTIILQDFGILQEELMAGIRLKPLRVIQLSCLEQGFTRLMNLWERYQ